MDRVDRIWNARQREAYAVALPALQEKMEKGAVVVMSNRTIRVDWRGQRDYNQMRSTRGGAGDEPA